MSGKSQSSKNRKIKLIVSDNDGTILSVHFWFAPAMLAAIPVVAAALNEPPEIVGGELGRNMINHVALETAFPFVGRYFAEKWKGTDEEFVEKVTMPYFAIFDSFLDKYASAYPGVRETFEEAEALGVRIAILSDAPMHATLAKLTAMGLHKSVSGVYSIEPHVPQGATVWNKADFDFCLKRLQRLLGLASGFGSAKVVQLPNSFEKPSTAGLQQILSDFGVGIANAIMLGDNCKKDGGIAHALGMRFGFARYGVNDFSPPQYTEAVASIITPAHDQTIRWYQVSMPASLPPIHKVLTTYADVIPLLRTTRRRSARVTAA